MKKPITEEEFNFCYDLMKEYMGFLIDSEIDYEIILPLMDGERVFKRVK